MPNRLLLAISIVLMFAASWLAQRWLAQSAPAACEAGPPQRIVTLAPSLTETLFALGLGDRVVGVSRFCRYPPEARQRPQAGGYLDPNFEAVVALQPDAVVLLEEQRETMPAFEKLGLRTIVVRHKDIEGILDSITILGRVCDARAQAARLQAGIRLRLERIERQTAGLPRPRVMVVVERTLGSGRLEGVQIAASDGHLGRLVELAGGQSALGGALVRHPLVSREGLLWIDPEVIIELVFEGRLAQLGRERIVADWQEVSEVSAVRHGRVYVVADDHALIPGPSFVQLAEQFARLIHPEIDWRER